MSPQNANPTADPQGGAVVHGNAVHPSIDMEYGKGAESVPYYGPTQHQVRHDQISKSYSMTPDGKFIVSPNPVKLTAKDYATGLVPTEWVRHLKVEHHAKTEADAAIEDKRIYEAAVAELCKLGAINKAKEAERAATRAAAEIENKRLVLIRAKLDEAAEKRAARARIEYATKEERQAWDAAEAAREDALIRAGKL